jgi:hypothetical protein
MEGAVRIVAVVVADGARGTNYVVGRGRIIEELVVRAGREGARGVVGEAEEEDEILKGSFGGEATMRMEARWGSMRRKMLLGWDDVAVIVALTERGAKSASPSFDTARNQRRIDPRFIIVST